MAALWLWTALVLAFLCYTSLSQGRIIPTIEDISISSPRVRGSQPELNSHFNGVIVSDCNPPMIKEVIKFQLRTQSSVSEVQSSSPGNGRIGDTASDWQSEDYSVSILQGKKWRRTLGKVAEWVLHACVVVLAVSAVFYAVSCVFACCIGLDLLAEIWRALGGCGALRALLAYFVRAEQAVAEGDSEPLVGSAQQPRK